MLIIISWWWSVLLGLSRAIIILNHCLVNRLPIKATNDLICLPILSNWITAALELMHILMSPSRCIHRIPVPFSIPNRFGRKYIYHSFHGVFHSLSYSLVFVEAIYQKEDTPLVQVQCIANIHIVGSNPFHTCVCGIFPYSHVSGVTSVKAI